MLIVRSTTHGEDARIFITDPETGETVSTVTDMATSDTLVGAIRSGDSRITLKVAKKMLGIVDNSVNINDLMEESRNKYQIKIDHEGNVTLPSGAVLPNNFRTMVTSVSKPEHVQAVLRFGEKLMKNPLDHAREALIDWILRNPSLAITPDGDVVGYRGLLSDFTSIHSGYGIVNGEHFTNAHLDNTPGNVIEFPRDMIDHNPKNLCSVGLHVGTWSYANDFQEGRMVIVTFSPTDVVSPPYDSRKEKIRVCKMISRAEVTSALPEDRIVIDDDMFEN